MIPVHTTKINLSFLRLVHPTMLEAIDSVGF
jgi:hypothetical protein